MQQQAFGLLLFLFLISLHTIFVFINTIKKGKNMSEKIQKSIQKWNHLSYVRNRRMQGY